MYKLFIQEILAEVRIETDQKGTQIKDNPNNDRVNTNSRRYVYEAYRDE